MQKYRPMKNAPCLLLFATMVLASCKQSSQNNINNAATVKTAVDSVPQATKELWEKYRASQKRIAEQAKYDSLNNQMLLEALNIAQNNTHEVSFHTQYEAKLDSIPMLVQLNRGYHFTKSHPHIIIRRDAEWYVYFDIYAQIEGNFQNVLSHSLTHFEYVSDTIWDINDDGLKDFVINWFGERGSWLKHFSNVYILQANRKIFSNTFRFDNPVFSPKEKVVRGIFYGPPGETEMYKYKWADKTLDTVEYVSLERNEATQLTGKIIVTTKLQPNNPNYKVLKVLGVLPKEYETIGAFGFFPYE